MKLIAIFCVLVMVISVSSTNYLLCAQDILAIVPELQQFVNDVKQVNSTDIFPVLYDLQNLINNVDVVADSCGINLPQPGGSGNIQNCLTDADTIAQYADAIVAFSGNILNDVANLEALIKALPQTEADCLGSQNIHIE